MAFFAASTWVVGGLAAASAYSSYSAASEQDENNAISAAQQQANTKRRYAIKSKISKSQMEEQRSLAMEKMTEVTRNFLATKGTMETMQAETMVAGNVAKRLKASARTTASEEKGQVAKVADSNITNIAQDMLSEKVDSEALLMQSDYKRKSTLSMLTNAGIAGVSTFVGAGGLTNTSSGVKG